MAGIYDRVMSTDGAAFGHAPSKEDPFVYAGVQSQAEGRMDGRWRASLGGSYDEQGRPPFVYDGSQAEGCSGHCGACRTRC